MAFKITEKEYALVRALSQVEGAVGEFYRTTPIDKQKETTEGFFQSLVWLNDDLRGYYVGYDLKSCGFILEWRGKIRLDKEMSEFRTYRLMTYTGTDLVLETVHAILTAIKKHKKFTRKEWTAE